MTESEPVAVLGPNDTFEIRLTATQLHLITQATNEIPTKYGKPLQLAIEAQVLEQINARAAAQKAAAEKAAADKLAQSLPPTPAEDKPALSAAA
jgi:hypothetical protein